MAVLIFSGGLDTTTLLWFLAKVEKHQKIHALTFNYGQRHLKEIEHAKNLLVELCNNDDLTPYITFSDFYRSSTAVNYFRTLYLFNRPFG